MTRGALLLHALGATRWRSNFGPDAAGGLGGEECLGPLQRFRPCPKRRGSGSGSSSASACVLRPLPASSPMALTVPVFAFKRSQYAEGFAARSI